MYLSAFSPETLLRRLDPIRKNVHLPFGKCTFFVRNERKLLLFPCAKQPFCAKSRKECPPNRDTPFLRLLCAIRFPAPAAKHRNILYSREIYAIIAHIFPICVTFLWYFDVNCALMSNFRFAVCSPHESGCFPLVDSLGARNNFCKPAADKRPSNFSACYNCFFSVIPLK